MFKKENIQNFVENMRETLPDRGVLKGILPVIIIFSGFLTLFYFFEFKMLEKNLIYWMVTFLLPIPSMIIIIYIFIKRKQEETYFDKHMCMGIGGAAMSLQFLLVSVCIPVSYDDGETLSATYLWIYLFCMILIMLISIYGIKRDWYRPKISWDKRLRYATMIVPAAAFGGAISILISKRINNHISDDVKWIMISAGSLFVAVMSIFGMTYFLKAYYVKKYGFTDPYEKKQKPTTTKMATEIEEKQEKAATDKTE